MVTVSGDYRCRNDSSSAQVSGNVIRIANQTCPNRYYSVNVAGLVGRGHSNHSSSGGAPCYTPGEETSTQKRPFKRPIAMHSATPKSSNFTSRVATGKRLTIWLQH